MSGSKARKAFAVMAVCLVAFTAFALVEGNTDDTDAGTSVWGKAFISESSAGVKITGTDTSSGNATKISMPLGYTKTFYLFSQQQIANDGPFFSEQGSRISCSTGSDSGTKTISGTTYYYKSFTVTGINSANTSQSVKVEAQANWIGDNYATKLNLSITVGVTVTLDAEGGSVSPSSITVTYGGTYGTLPTPTKSGSTFEGWYTEPDGDGSRVTSSTTMSTATNHTLFASWSATAYTMTLKHDDNCTITAKNNTTGSQSTSSITYHYGDSITLTAKNITAGYEFKNFTRATATGQSSISSVNPWTTTTLSGDMTVRANTVEKTTYKLTVTAQNCSVMLYNYTLGTSSSSGSLDCNYNDSIRLVATPNTGYTFSSWEIKTTYGWTPVSTNTTYSTTFSAHAKIEYRATAMANPVTVTFDAAGGNVIGSATKQVVPGQAYGTLPTAQRDFYSFVGWYTDTTGPEAFITEETIVSQTSDFTVHALWSSVTVTVTLEPNGGTIAGGETTITVNYGQPVTLPAITKAGQTLLYWLHEDIASATFTVEDEGTFTPQYDLTLEAIWATPTFTVTLYSNITDTTTVYQTLEGNDNERPVTLPAISRANYHFEGWYTQAVGGTREGGAGSIYGPTENVSLYAHWSAIGGGWIDWSNDLENGRVQMIFHYEGQGDYQTHTMRLYLDSYQQTDDSVSFADSGYRLEISITYYPAAVTATLKNGGATIVSNTANIGNWANFIMTFDALNSSISYSTLTGYTNIMSWTEYKAKTLLDYSSVITSLTIPRIAHQDTGTGDHVRFSVISTDAYLDTFNTVLVDPTINIYNYFPEYDEIRLNFYSFAIYGDSVTINGRTYAVDDDKVTIYYVQDRDRNNLVTTQGGPDVMSKTLTLSNIYVTWDGSNCLLTFVNDKFTVNMGPYAPTNLTVSFSGIWYFTTAVWSPYTAEEVHWGLDLTNPLPSVSGDALILAFIAIAIIGLLVASRYYTIGLLDYIVVIGAGIIAYLIIGGI